MICFMVTFAALFYGYWRMFSKNLAARQSENDKYVGFKEGIKAKFSGQKSYRENKKKYKDTHVFFTCKKCHHHLKVPKGKGKIIVTCPNCHEKFEANT